MLALLLSVVAAVGPAAEAHAEYTWPPTALPARAPDLGWYAPLPLLNRVPETIEVRLPCDLSPALNGREPATVLATARDLQATGGLRIALGGRALRIELGRSEIARVPWPAACPLRLTVEDGKLRLPTRTVQLPSQALDEMPVVTGLFTGLDLRAGQPPGVVVGTRYYATSQTVRQVLAAAAGCLLSFAALILLSRHHREPRPDRSPRRLLRSAWEARHATDAVVLLTLLVWWIVAPTFSDDGWVWVEHRSFDDLGTNAFYYDTWGINAPFGFWFEWLRHWASGATNDLVFMRLPSLLVLLAAWPLCRWCLHLTAAGRAGAVVRWTLAGVFVLNAAAWGMTLRPEPFISLLVLVSLAATVTFVRSPRPGPLAVAVPAAVLAVSAHPVGVVAAAPLLAAAPATLRWLRSGGRAALLTLGALLAAGLALALILLTLDTDLPTRLAQSSTAGQGQFHHDPWWREYVRYERFDANGGGTVVRRLSLALLLLSVVALLTRRRSSRTDVLLVPARSVGVALVLLALIPSKWPWHFGVLAGIGAVAVAAEVARLVREPVGGWNRMIRPIAALVVVCGAALWAWRAPGSWGHLDLIERSWRDVFNGYVLVALAGVMLAVAVWNFAWLRHGRGLVSGLSVLTGWTLVVASFGVVTLTMAVLAVDGAVAPWSATKQNLEALRGGSSCGLAHQLRGDEDLVTRLADPKTPTLLVPSVGVYFPCATIPRTRGGLVEVPRLVVFESSPWPLLEGDGPFAAVPDLYRITTIARGPHAVEAYSVANTVPGFVRVDALRRS